MLLVLQAAQGCQALPGALLPAARMLQGALPALLQPSRSCSHNALPGTGAGVAAPPPHQQATTHQRAGNVYGPLSAATLAAMRQRRLTSNCSPEQLASSSRRASVHQAKSIILCSSGGASCRASCKACDGCALAAQRSWEYLQKRLKEINQLRAEGDEKEPILGTRIDCVQAQSLLPPLAATMPCHGPIAVVYPEGVFYDRLSPLVLERIIEEHLLGGHVVTSHVMMGSRTSSLECHNVLPALDITRRATPNGHFAAHYAR